MIKKILLAIFFILVITQVKTPQAALADVKASAGRLSVAPNSAMKLAEVKFAEETYRITSANFDTSNSIMFITSPDNTVEPILKSIKLVKLSKPNRAFFDINSAVLAMPPQHWFFSSGGLKEVKIGQFSTNPNKIRIVMYFEEGFNPAKINFLRINNNLAINFKNGQVPQVGAQSGVPKDEYFKNVYREQSLSNDDFYEKLAITNEDTSKVQVAVNNAKSDAVLNEIQQAFNASTAPDSHVKQVSAKPTPAAEIIKKNLKLTSKCYIDVVSIKPEGVLLNGIGAMDTEKPMYLANPARVVFDLPNTVLAPELKNKEFKINEKESVKFGQFSASKVRVVITSDVLEKYLPIFSADGQSLLIANHEKVTPTSINSFAPRPADAVSYFYKDVNTQTDEFIVAFNAPLVHGIKRDPTKLTIYLYNVLRYNDETFKSVIKSTTLGEMKIELLPKIGLKLTLPLKVNNVVSCDFGADAKSIKITVRGPKTRIAQPYVASAQKTIIFKSNGERVVLDAGHGGVDYGAIRAGINEKDITLDVTKRVEAILVSRGIKVAMTRGTDETVSLQGRTTITENKKPDLFVSIHVNSCTGTGPCGVETHYYHPGSLELAQTVHSSMVSYIKSPDRGLIKSKFYVINHTSVPAILVEIGFISNDHERAELVSEQRKQQTAKAIAEGIMKYLNKK